MLSEEAVAVLHNLVTSADQIEVVTLEEFLQLLSAEDPAASSLVLFPVSDVFIGIIPDKIGNEALVWHVCRFWELLYLLKRVHVLTEPSVHTHDLFIYQGDEGHVVETGVELLPKGDLVPPLDLIEESIYSRDGLTFVVSSQNHDL